MPSPLLMPRLALKAERAICLAKQNLATSTRFHPKAEP